METSSLSGVGAGETSSIKRGAGNRACGGDQLKPREWAPWEPEVSRWRMAGDGRERGEGVVLLPVSVIQVPS